MVTIVIIVIITITMSTRRTTSHHTISHHITACPSRPACPTCSLQSSSGTSPNPHVIHPLALPPLSPPLYHNHAHGHHSHNRHHIKHRSRHILTSHCSPTTTFKSRECQIRCPSCQLIGYAGQVEASNHVAEEGDQLGRILTPPPPQPPPQPQPPSPPHTHTTTTIHTTTTTIRTTTTTTVHTTTVCTSTTIATTATHPSDTELTTTTTTTTITTTTINIVDNKPWQRPISTDCSPFSPQARLRQHERRQRPNWALWSKPMPLICSL